METYLAYLHFEATRLEILNGIFILQFDGAQWSGALFSRATTTFFENSDDIEFSASVCSGKFITVVINPKTKKKKKTLRYASCNPNPLS